MVKTPPSTLGSRLRMARKRKKLTLQQVAEKLDLTHAAIGQWERGKITPSTAHLLAVADLYVVSTDWLLRGGPISAGFDARINTIPPGPRAQLSDHVHEVISKYEVMIELLTPEMLRAAREAPEPDTPPGPPMPPKKHGPKGR